MKPVKTYVCIQPIPNSIFRPGMKVYIYEKDLSGSLDKLLTKKTNYFTVIEHNK